MALTTHEHIRIESGFQHRFSKERFQTEPTGGTVFYVRSDDPVKIVPNFETGGTIAGVSDIKVWCGLSGIQGSSRMSVSSIDAETGRVSLTTAPISGCSLTIDYASSPLTSDDIEQVRLRSESIINQRLSLCYDLPITPVPSMIKNLVNRLSAAFLLMRGYGTGSRNTSSDGYALYEQLMGTQAIGGGQVVQGEVNLICTPDYQLVDDDGVVIGRNDTEYTTDSTYMTGGRVVGRLYDITQENFRFKDYQADANAEQPGSGTNYGNP